MCVWNGRGGACVPARTSAQRRFHTKIYLRITHHARGFNDGCALAGRHGRAHRRRPYPSLSYFSVQSAHNQWAHRPRSYNTNHHLEMNERTNSNCPQILLEKIYLWLIVRIHWSVCNTAIRTPPTPITSRTCPIRTTQI